MGAAPPHILILLPDGVGLRNFAMGDFVTEAARQGLKLTYWNHTSYPVSDLGLDQWPMAPAQLHPFTTVLARARKRCELNQFDRQFGESVYNTYNFPQSYKGIKNALRSLLVDVLTATQSHPKGIRRIRRWIKSSERRSVHYHRCKAQLQALQPNLVFCTNPRASVAIAPILAAQDLGIRTASFIFSWDNLPKATTLIEPDYYVVWSAHMRDELLQYCPYVQPHQIAITGSPQFETHFKTALFQTRQDFLNRYGLDASLRYICFSGDDYTTSPLDPYYLEDTARSVRELRAKGMPVGILFRRCPVDLSARYDEVLAQYADVITPIAPLWKAYGQGWTEVFPEPDDAWLLAQIAEYCDLVVNVASTMVFDFVAHGKPCLFFNYEQPQRHAGIRDIGQNYRYIHFRSMPSPQAALFVDDPNTLTAQLEAILLGQMSNVPDGKRWFERIAGPEPWTASLRLAQQLRQWAMAGAKPY